MPTEPALTSLFAHIYGPTVGREVAELAGAGPGERVAILIERTDGRGVYVAAPVGPDETVDDSDVQDPLPVVTFAASHHELLAAAADVVVAMPPVGRGADDRVEAFFETLRADAPGRRAILLVPANSLSSPKSSVRAALTQAGAITHLSFARARGNSLGIHSTFEFAIVRLLPGAADQQAEVRDAHPSASGGPFTRVLPATGTWTFAALDPEREARIREWAQRAGARPLYELVTVNPSDRPEMSEAPLLRGRGLSQGGIDLEDDEQTDRRSARPAVALRSGDVVGRSIGEPLWMVVEDEHLPLAADIRSIHVLDPGDLDPWLLVAFLNSSIAQLQMEAALAGTLPRTSPRMIRELLTPDLRILDHASPAAEVDRLQLSADQLLADLRSELDAAFDTGDGDAMRSLLVEAKRDARLASALIGQVRDPRYRARQTMPHPLARAIRCYELSTPGDARETYEALLRMSETAIILLGATFGSYLLSRNEEPAPQLRTWAAKLAQGGPSLGHWLDIARKGAETARRASDDLGGLARAMRSNGPLLAGLEVLLTQRNDDAHGGAPRSPYEYQVRSDELAPLFDDLVDGLSALTHGDCFIVEGLEFDGRGTFRVRGRDLRGDHPDFRPWERITDAPMETSVVYVTLGDVDLSLAAFCQLLSCPRCLREEMYYPDRLRGDEARLRSLERGHQYETMRPAEVNRISTVVDTVLPSTG